MSEIIKSFPIDNPDKLIPMDRKKFYQNQVDIFKIEGHPSMAVEVVNILLFNESGELILQKRSNTKGHNPGLIDKSVGGHVVNGDNADFTVMLETVQELQVPSIVLKNHNDFLKTLYLLKDYTSSTSIIEHINTEIVHIPKKINDQDIVIATKTYLYFGIYAGSIKNVDKEAKGVLFYEFNELLEEMEQFPDIFTKDLHIFSKKYETNIREFVQTITMK